jgi:hypothetical protein
MNRLVSESEAIGKKVRSGEILLKGSVYSLSSGEVSVLAEKG